MASLVGLLRRLSMSTDASATAAVSVSRQRWAFPPEFVRPRQVWIENMNTVAEEKVGVLDLHPEVFAVEPRLDIVHKNVAWQRMYRYVNYAQTKTRAEVKGGGRKPWPQKGLGRARHGSIRSPLFKGGGVAHGPRAFTTHFYMLPYHVRIKGLTVTLSSKLAQDDLHVVDEADVPSREPDYVKELARARNWGPSVLIVDDTDIMPVNITAATDAIPHINLMPVYGLNVYSMLKHDTLVLTVAAAQRIEERILECLHLRDPHALLEKFKLSQ